MTTPTAEQLNDAVRGFDLLVGVRFLSCTDAQASAQFDVRDELRQPVGLLHGGVLASVAESLTSLATALGVLERGEVAMGLSNHTSFLRPVFEGTVTATAQRLHRGRTTWVWDVRFTDSQERLCAVARTTIAVRPAPEGLAMPPWPAG
jgi:uncharacterized protein (TIGR00369 family)